jgi:predicted nucleotidyltransferase component of viral defense system
MSEDTPRIVDIKSWVDRARRDPVAYIERQATGIVLSAIGNLPYYGSRIFLKGGILMAVVYQSLRGTADIDFTTDLEASPALPAELRTALDKELVRTTARLGFPDLVLQVQTVKERPRPFGTADLQFPALYVTIAYAMRGSKAERHFRNGQGPHVIELEISFNEPVHAIEVVRLGASGSSFSAYALTDLIAEKFRALLQQVTRNRYRRQDVYDIAYLAERFPPDEGERAEILVAFQDKCAARNIVMNIDGLSNPDVSARARSEWDTLSQEIGELPDFDECFAKVETLYRSLPWKHAPDNGDRLQLPAAG